MATRVFTEEQKQNLVITVMMRDANVPYFNRDLAPCDDPKLVAFWHGNSVRHVSLSDVLWYDIHEKHIHPVDMQAHANEEGNRKMNEETMVKHT